MGIKTLEQLAPWIAIAFTLALSILVPLFTQMANNNFQLKIQKHKENNERKIIANEEKRGIYADFLCNVGGCIVYASKENLSEVGASIQKMYLICPQEWWNDLDEIYSYVRESEWKKAEIVLKKINKLVAAEYSLIN